MTRKSSLLHSKRICKHLLGSTVKRMLYILQVNAKVDIPSVTKESKEVKARMADFINSPLILRIKRSLWSQEFTFISLRLLHLERNYMCPNSWGNLEDKRILNKFNNKWGTRKKSDSILLSLLV